MGAARMCGGGGGSWDQDLGSQKHAAQTTLLRLPDFIVLSK